MTRSIYAAALVLAFTSPASAAPLPESSPMVAFNVAPGLVVHIPKEWSACEAEARARLSPVSEIPATVAEFCAGMAGSAMTKLGAVDSRPDHGLGVVVMQGDRQPITPEALDALTPEGLAGIQHQMCDKGMGPNFRLLHCAVTLGRLGNRRALVADTEVAAANAPNSPITTLSYGVPYGTRYCAVIFKLMGAARGAAQPRIDAIAAAVEIE